MSTPRDAQLCARATDPALSLYDAAFAVSTIATGIGAIVPVPCTLKE